MIPLENHDSFGKMTSQYDGGIEIIVLGLGENDEKE
jgi:hypothetical protein